MSEQRPTTGVLTIGVRAGQVTMRIAASDGTWVEQAMPPAQAVAVAERLESAARAAGKLRPATLEVKA
jgi:hypothetical protein